MSEIAFVLPDDVAYRENGLAGAVGFLKRTTEFSLPPNNLKDDIDKFVPKNCNCRVCRRCKEEGIAQYLRTGGAC